MLVGRHRPQKCQHEIKKKERDNGFQVIKSQMSWQRIKQTRSSIKLNTDMWEETETVGKEDVGRGVLQTEIFKGMDKAMFHMTKTERDRGRRWCRQRDVWRKGGWHRQVWKRSRGWKEEAYRRDGWMDGERREMWKSGASSSYRRVGIERQRHTDTIIPQGHQVNVVNWLPLTSWDKTSSGTSWLGLRRVSCVPYYTLIVSDKTKCTQKMFVFDFSSCCPTMQRTKQKVTAAKKKKSVSESLKVVTAQGRSQERKKSRILQSHLLLWSRRLIVQQCIHCMILLLKQYSNLTTATNRVV